jgi:hypothetical protein
MTTVKIGTDELCDPSLLAKILIVLASLPGFDASVDNRRLTLAFTGSRDPSKKLCLWKPLVSTKVKVW